MRQIFVASLLLLSCICVIRCEEYFSIVGSRTIQHGSRYSLYIDSSKLNNDDTVIMKLNGQKGDLRRVTASNETSHKNDQKVLEFKLNETRLANDYKLSILSHRNGMCAFEEIPIFPIRKEYSVFIQLDKPFYKPNDRIRFRIVMIDQNTLPFKPNSIYIRLTDMKGDISSELRVSGEDINMGIYENNFFLSEQADVGTWSISVLLNNHENKATTKTFEVKEEMLPLLDVNIESSSYLFHTDSKLSLNIFAKYSFGIPAKGNANVKAKVYDNDRILKYSTIKNISIETNNTVVFDIVNDLKIKPEDPHRIIQVIVNFTDEMTGRKFNKSKEVSFRNKNSFFIRVYNKKTFVPTNNYEFYVSIKDFDGIPQTSKSYPITMKCVYQNNEHIELVQPSFLDNGFASFNWFVPKDVKAMKITVEYRDSSKTFDVKAGHETKNENFEVSIVSKEPSLKELLTVQLKAVNKIGIINYVVTGKFGVAVGGSFDCQLKDTCQFSFMSNVKMLPKATLMVYYVSVDGELISDTNKINFKDLSSNFLNIKVPKKSIAPGSNVTFSIESSPNSLVALLGIDESLAYLERGNDFDHTDVSRDLLRYGHTDFLIHHPKAKIIDNSFVYYQNFKNLHPCTPEERNMLNLYDLNVKPKRLGRSVDENEAEIKSKVEDPDEPRIRRDFREIFIFDSVNVDQDGKANFQTQLPDTITTWLITGFAMNQQNGFALAEPTQITTMKQLFIKLHLPYSIKFDEILKVEATVFSFVESQNPIKVDITMVSRDEEQQYFEFIIDSQKLIQDEMTKNVSVSQNSAQSVFFLIRPLKSGEMKVLVSAKSAFASDMIEKTIIVEEMEITTTEQPTPKKEKNWLCRKFGFLC